MLEEDAVVSGGAALQCQDGHYRFHACPLHSAQYKLRTLELKCPITDCFKISTCLVNGQKYCSYHSSDVENSASTPQTSLSKTRHDGATPPSSPAGGVCTSEWLTNCRLMI